MNRTHAYWLCQIIGWTLIVTALVGFNLLYSTHILRFALMYGTGIAGGLICSHLFRARIRRHRWIDLHPAQAVPRVLAGTFITALGITGMVSLSALPLLGVKQVVDTFAYWFPSAYLVWTTTCLIWTILYFGIHYFERYQRSEIQRLQLAVVAKDAELRALLWQVNPHFMFNCLNSVRALIAEDPARAQSMVTELSNILRYTLQSGRTETVSLGQELEAVRAYLKLEAMRFEERLRIVIEVEPALLETRIPPMLVQTLVENGVKHGIAQLPEGGELRVTSIRAQGSLKIRVVNTGQIADASDSTRVGLENARQRLQLLYGSRASLLLRNADSDSVLAEVSLPV